MDLKFKICGTNAINFITIRFDEIEIELHDCDVIETNKLSIQPRQANSDNLVLMHFKC